MRRGGRRFEFHAGHVIGAHHMMAWAQHPPISVLIIPNNVGWDTMARHWRSRPSDKDSVLRDSIAYARQCDPVFSTPYTLVFERGIDRLYPRTLSSSELSLLLGATLLFVPDHEPHRDDAELHVPECYNLLPASYSPGRGYWSVCTEYKVLHPVEGIATRPPGFGLRSNQTCGLG